MRPFAAPLLIFLSLLLGARWILFGNAAAWNLYKDRTIVRQGKRFFNPGNRTMNDFHRLSVLAEEKRLAPSGRVSPLAFMGSSQLAALFGYGPPESEEVWLQVLPGMNPLDLLLHLDMVLAARPETVVLYLADYDLQRAPSFVTALSSPRQGGRLLRVFPALAEWAWRRNSFSGPLKLAALEAFPEARFAFVLKEMRDLLFLRWAKNWSAEDEFRRQRLLSPYDQGLPLLLARPAPEFRLQTRVLRLLVDELADSGSQVHLVEADHRLRISAPNAEIDRLRFTRTLAALAEESEGVFWHPLETLPLMADRDFQDSQHLHVESGRKVLSSILNKIGYPDAL